MILHCRVHCTHTVILYQNTTLKQQQQQQQQQKKKKKKKKKKSLQFVESQNDTYALLMSWKQEKMHGGGLKIFIITCC